MKHTAMVPLAAILILSGSAGATAARQAAPAPAAGRAPIRSSRASPLPFQAPPFDKIKDARLPARDRRGHAAAARRGRGDREQTRAADLRQHASSRWSARACCSPASPRSSSTSTQSNTNDTLQKIKADDAPKLAAHSDAIFLNAKLFARVKALYDQRDTLGLDAGVAVPRRALPPRLRARRRAALRRGQDDAPRAQPGRVDADDRVHRPAARRHERARGRRRRQARARRAERSRHRRGGRGGQGAEARRASGCSRCRTRRSSRRSPRSTNRALRERLFQASIAARDHGDANDTQAIVARLAQLRAQRAKLLGYPTLAAYVLDDQMAKTPQTRSSC